MVSLQILVAPSGFKECPSTQETASSIARGVKQALKDAVVTEFPLVDGGEGFTAYPCRALGGDIYPLKVTGPVGKPVNAFWGMLKNEPQPTAVIEMAAAAGLRLVPNDMRNPLLTTTYGVADFILRI